MALSSNAKRAARRTECRQKLSDHIYRKLGIRVPPEQVRLQPRRQDPYVWSYPPSKEHLFLASLSRGTVGTFDQICEELDRSIEVVSRSSVSHSLDDDRSEAATSTPLDPALGDDSFTAQIQRLRDEKSSIEKELHGAYETARHEGEEKKHIAQLLSDSRRQVTQWKLTAEQYRNGMERLAAALGAAITTLQAARPNESHLHDIRKAWESAARLGSPSPELVMENTILSSDVVAHQSD